MPIVYPKWKYHRTLPPCVIDGPVAEAALGEGWADTPAFFYCLCRPGESCPNCPPPAPAAPDPANTDGEAQLAQPNGADRETESAALGLSRIHRGRRKVR